MIEHLDLELIVKADERGAFDGLATVYDRPDRVGDVIQAGAFDPIPSSVPVLWHHMPTEVVGKADLTDSREALMVRGQLLLDTAAGHDAYSRLAAGVSSGLSLGFRLLDSRKQNGYRLITKAELIEVSLTAFPIMAAARVTAVKAESCDAMRRLVLARLRLFAQV